MAKQRLQKILAAAGIGSRRACEDLIEQGVVRVNRKVVDELPAFADPGKDVITVSGKRVYSEKKVYYLLNKPKGVICTSSDPRGRKTAVSLVEVPERVFCVGRLDADTTGLIILTNDSELANLLTHPRYGVPKTYVAKVKGRANGEAIEKLKKGVWLSEGKTGRAAVRIARRGKMESLVEITITQGLNRQIRRMFAKVGLPVKGLKRTRIGRIDDRGLGQGKFRHLTKVEIAYLKSAGRGGKSRKKRS